MEKKSEKHKESSPVLQEPDIREFIEERGIRSEDFVIIEELATFPNQLVIELLHNLFNMNCERSADVLKHDIALTERESHRRLYALFQRFLAAYNWATCYNLVRVLEKRKNTPAMLNWKIEEDGRNKN